VGVEWRASADRHHIPHEDALYVIGHPTGTEDVEGLPGWTTTVYVGHPNEYTDRFIEVIAGTREPRRLAIFHVMELSDPWRHLAYQEGESND
jgi:hypothetical protein